MTEKKLAPFTKFGVTKNVPIEVWQNNKQIESTEWDDVIWIERCEDWYGLMSVGKKRVRIIRREVWLTCDVV